MARKPKKKVWCNHDPYTFGRYAFKKYGLVIGCKKCIPKNGGKL